MAGEWAGTAKLWFERGVLVEENKVRCTTEALLGGRFLHCQYSAKSQEFDSEGLGIYGFDLQRGIWIGSRVDNYHNGTTRMVSEGNGKEVAEGFSVLGRYSDGQGGYWGWRTELRLDGPEHLVIAHFNIPPGEPEYIAVEYAMGRA
ncbi:DUF1579 family protein [bacterium]|nr:DUF1579 family protein [bacterium]